MKAKKFRDYFIGCNEAQRIFSLPKNTEHERSTRLTLWNEHKDECEPCKEHTEAYRRNLANRERNQCMRDLGMARVKGALGGIYWE